MLATGFDGKGFVLVGRACQIGREIKVTAEKRGASVFYCAHSENWSLSAQTLHAHGDRPGPPALIQENADSESGIESLFDIAFEQLPGIHVLIHHIGKVAPSNGKLLAETSLSDWNNILLTKLRAPFLLSRRAIEEFLASGEGGRIVYIIHSRENSELTHVGLAAAQTALASLTHSIAREYGRRGIACNSVVIQDAAKPATIAETVLFLASNEASFINGESIYLGVCDN